MKRAIGILALLICALSGLHSQKRRLGPPPPKAVAGVDYPIKIHISGIHIRSHCSELKGPAVCWDVLYVDSLINDKRLELMGDRIWFPNFYLFAVLPGDYKARILKDTPNRSIAPLDREYELILPDGTAWRRAVTGMSE
jgi:hypothetical protein